MSRRIYLVSAWGVTVYNIIVASLSSINGDTFWAVACILSGAVAFFCFNAVYFNE